jgi:adenine-specific DNA methylase
MSRAVSIHACYQRRCIKQLTARAIIRLRVACARYDSPIVRSYGGHYFSWEQAAWIDALRATKPLSEPGSSIALAALITAASECAASPGHTAQPFQPTPRAIRFIGEAWSRDAVTRTKERFVFLSNSFARRRGRSLVEDANVFAASLGKGDVVFVDPPYSGVHYSRYYHVLKTIARGGCKR